MNLYLKKAYELFGLNKMPKFMQTLDSAIYKKLLKIAKERGTTVQELIRAVIIPEWFRMRKE